MKEFMIHFRAWQIEHYTLRLSEAKDIKEKIFLRNELRRLKSTPDV